MEDARRYYLGTGPEAAALAERAARELQAAWDARRALCREWGSDSLAIAGDAVRGLAFREEQADKPWLRLLEKVEGWFVYGGDRRWAKGKALSAALRAPELKADACDRIALELKLSRTVLSGGRLLSTVLWAKPDGRILVSIPSAPLPQGWQGDPYPDVPAWLREISQEEWNSIWNEEVESDA